MKKFFYFALMAGFALTNVACSSDDDDSKKDTALGNQQKGAYEEQVATYTITSDTPAAQAVMADGTTVDASLKGFDVVADGQLVFETEVAGESRSRYTTYDVVIKDNVYTVKDAKGAVAGTITKAVAASRTRGESTVSLDFNLTISVEIGGVLVPLTFESTTVAQETIDTIVDNLTSSLSNTWEIENMKLSLDFDEKTDVSTTATGGSLKPFLELAESNDVNLSESDKANLDRTISNLIIEKNKLFVLRYADGRSDAANWKWDSKDDGNLGISIELKGVSEGNKFFNNNSSISVVLRSGNKASLTLQTRLGEDKCTAYLIVNLK